MASIIEGYTYDIFISYRQKDNKGDRWVSECVNALKDELESTFKEEVSVYFDINLHDGLLETHDVDASLKEKLKCLVFIPVISRTYCDPKSFAWENEFKAFVEQASQDQFGLKVKLPNGNVANRILPVRIHDLDNADIKLCESVIGGVLRGVEFIYKEPGVNRSLTPKDDERKNLNGTIYRNQINKVALAIKEIILGLKTEPVIQEKEKTQHKEPIEEVDREERKPGYDSAIKLTKRKLFSWITFIVILIITAVLFYPKIFKPDKLANLRSSDGRISVAVMPFQNMTNDTTLNVWQDGIQEILTNSLSTSEELRVRQTENVKSLIQSKGLKNYASITPSIAGTISQKLDADVFVYGKIIQAKQTLRVYAQLIESNSEEVFKSFQIEGTPENILPILDSLSRMVKNFLVISKYEKEVNLDYQQFASTNSLEAYKYFIYGKNAYEKIDLPTEVAMLSHAVELDSNFFWATIMLAYAYSSQGLYEEAKKCCLNVYKKRDQMPMQLKIWTNFLYSEYFETPKEAIDNMRQLQEIDDQLPLIYYNVGRHYNYLYQYDKAIPEFEKALAIYDKWGSKPMYIPNYTLLGIAYHKTGQYKKEKELYKKAEQFYSNDPLLIYRQTILSLTEADTVSANKYIEKYISIRKGNSWSEASIVSNLASIYSESDILDKAEKYYRQALSLEPKSLDILNNLAYFLIEKDRNINEGLELIGKALELRPDNYSYLHCKGWGLYKQGKYKEALEILEKSWDLRMENARYNHEAYLHFQEAKKAVANRK